MVDWLLELSELLLLELDFSLRFCFLLPPARSLGSPPVDSPLGSLDEVLGWRGLFFCVRHAQTYASSSWPAYGSVCWALHPAHCAYDNLGGC